MRCWQARRAHGRCALHWSDEPHECLPLCSNAVPSSMDLRPCALLAHHSSAALLTINQQTATTRPNIRCPRPSSPTIPSAKASSPRPRPKGARRKRTSRRAIVNHPLASVRPRHLSVNASATAMEIDDWAWKAFSKTEEWPISRAHTPQHSRRQCRGGGSKFEPAKTPSERN